MAIRQSDSIQYGPFLDGVFYDRDEEDVTEAGISSMQNMRVEAGGAVETRRGTASYKSAANIASDPTLTMCCEFTVPPATTYVVIVAGSAIYKYASGWSAITGSVSITAADDNTFEWADSNGVLYATNGVNAPWKWTGTSTAAVVPSSTTDQVGTAQHIAFWDNRLWYGNEGTNYDRLWYSNIGDSDTIGASQFYNIGYQITGLVPMQNSLTVHTDHGIHTLVPTGNATIPYQLQKRTGEGTVSGRAIVRLPRNRQMFIRNDGIYMWEGGDDIEKKTYNFDLGYWPDLIKSRFSQTFGLYFPEENEAWFWVPYGTGQTNMNHILVYSDRFDMWYGPYNGTGSYFTRNCAALIDDKPHAGTLNGSGSVGGTLEDHWAQDVWNDDDNSSDGTLINQYFVTGAPAPDGSDQRVRWRYARTYFDATGDFNVSVTQESSGLSGTIEILNVKGGGFALNNDELDEANLGTVRMLSKDTDLTEYDPHTSLKFSNAVLNNFFRIRRTHPVFSKIGRKRKPKPGVS